ncbi:MAG: xanthine dehydrogenase family protein subunit M [Oscillospiraceae bacterium]|nr:xanthine dehydrogenase family protein subunit M [Oscillospiraceae bacterium]
MHFDLHRPNSIQEALDLYEKTNGSYLAGGTVLLVNHHRGADIGRHLISLEGIAALQGIRETEEGIVIGACTTLDAIECSDLLRREAYSLWQAAAQTGGPQIRNRATIGGNVAAGSPSSDLAAPLLVLGAVMRLEGPNGKRELPIKDLFIHVFKTALLPGEFITEFVIPRKADIASKFVKVGKRNALAVSCINMAVAFNSADGWSVAVGAAAPTPRLCRGTMDILNAGTLDEARLSQACEMILTEIAPIDDRWATASYRRKVCVNLLKTMVKEVRA